MTYIPSFSFPTHAMDSFSLSKYSLLGVMVISESSHDLPSECCMCMFPFFSLKAIFFPLCS